MPNDIEALHRDYLGHTHGNELEILTSSECRCLHCGSSFSARKVAVWYNDGKELSAACPVCGLHYVVGDASSLPLGDPLFSSIVSFISVNQSNEDARRDLLDFCSNFYDGKFEDTEEYERLYIRYLEELQEDEDPMACLALARLYAHGLRFTQSDIDMAISYYRSPLLLNDSTSIFELGVCYDARNGRGDARAAFEQFAKAAALGSYSASIAIANYYLQGKYVRRDLRFGFNLLLSVFGEMYPRALTDLPNIAELATTANSLAVCIYEGLGVKANHFRALRYYLLARYFGKMVQDRTGNTLQWMDATEKEIHRLQAEEFHPSSEDPVFDEDTFFDSFYDQYDNVSAKRIIDAHVDEEKGAVVIKTAFAHPMLIIDVANGIVDAYSEVEWRFNGAAFEDYQGPSDFVRFEFGWESVSFLHEDPILGETSMLRLVLPPEEEGEGE